MTIYLAGAINACTDDQAMGWREMVKRDLLGCAFRDPMVRDYRGKELESVSTIVYGDLADIVLSDVVLVNAGMPSWGTAMEIVYAKQFGKRIIAVCPNPKPSPWLLHHSEVVQDFESAYRLIR